jgi:hypothetical protein
MSEPVLVRVARGATAVFFAVLGVLAGAHIAATVVFLPLALVSSANAEDAIVFLVSATLLFRGE